jgi:4-alpha-glucanotransferase
MALKEVHGGAALKTWAEELIRRDPDALDGWREKLSQETSFYEYLQFEFLRQWKSLKAYAGERGVEIIGDLPIYVSEDSADFWAHPELFQVDERGRIRRVAGVPPDGFSADGQLWGNPLYNWDYHKKTGYEWWIRRIRKCTELYDVMRLDHFRGFDEYFSIPAEDHTAKNGVWEKGPGLDLFRALKKACPDLRIIAEDLGYVTDTVRQLVRDTGFPNMKILEFAFDSRDSTGRWEYMPYNYERNCAVYTGTHDNETLTGWLDSILPEEAAEVREFFGVPDGTKQETVQAMIRAAFASTANLCIIPLQDYLGLDNRARINQPSTFGKNWKWRARKEQLDTELQERIRRLTELYGRTRL